MSSVTDARVHKGSTGHDSVLVDQLSPLARPSRVQSWQQPSCWRFRWLILHQLDGATGPQYVVNIVPNVPVRVSVDELNI